MIRPFLIILLAYLINHGMASPFRGRGQKPITTKDPNLKDSKVPLNPTTPTSVDLHCTEKPSKIKEPIIDTKAEKTSINSDADETKVTTVKPEKNSGPAEGKPARSNKYRVSKRTNKEVDIMSMTGSKIGSEGGVLQVGIITDKGTKIRIDMANLTSSKSEENSTLGHVEPILMGENPIQHGGIDLAEDPTLSDPNPSSEKPAESLDISISNSKITIKDKDPKVKDGKCRPLTKGLQCLKLTPESGQCTQDSNCPGSKKCCFYGCPPESKNIGVCENAIYSDD